MRLPWRLRTETTINNTYDFGVGRRLKNLAALRQIVFAANRRVLAVEQLTHDCHIGAEAFDKPQKPAEVNGRHVSALPFGQERVPALLAVLVMFWLQPEGFRHRQLRPLLAQSLGLSELHHPRASESSTVARDFAKFQKALGAYAADKMAA